jgi:hypothetical protein
MIYCKSNLCSRYSIVEYLRFIIIGVDKLIKG